MLSSAAVLIHSCHLQASDWEKIAWGDPEKGVLGRVPKALLVAIEHKSELIFWGTGASEIDGKKESWYTYEYSLKQIRSLSEVYSQSNFGMSVSETIEWIESVSRADSLTQNTVEEIAEAGLICLERGVMKLILVSSPTHIARCHQEALKLREQGGLKNLAISAEASDTCYFNSTSADVVIIEPPHRGDRPQVPFHKTVKGIFQFLSKPDIAFEFNEALASLIGNWKRRL